MPPKVKCHGVNWKAIYDLLYMLHKRFDICSIDEMQPVTLIWPLNVIQGQMSWDRLIVHDFLDVFLINYGHNELNLLNIAHWKLDDLDLPFQFHQRLNGVGKLKGHIWLTIYIYHANFDHMTKPLEMSVTLIWKLKIIQGHKVNWNIIYDLVYVLHINIGHSMHRFGDISPNK